MWFLFLLACPRSVAPALEVTDADRAAARVDPPEPTDPTERLAWMVGEDPLVRRPRLPATPLGEPLARWIEVAREPAPPAADWWALEHRFPGTEVVPFARGGRLAALETHLGEVEAALDDAVPLPRNPHPAGPDARPALAWLGTSSTDTLLGVTERSVLLGWLDGPALDTRPAGRQLAGDRWARLAAIPAGRLLRARAEGRRDAAQGAAGAADLALATTLMLETVAADTATDRTALQAEQARVLGTLGATTGDPVALLLTRAREALTADAGADASAGLALVALQAERWKGACPDAPCGGLDRGVGLHAAMGWGPAPAAAAGLWRVAALKDARDHLDAAYDRASFPGAVTETVEALLGLDPLAPLDRGILSRARPDATVHLALARAADGRDATDAKGLFEALDARLKREVAAVRPLADPRSAAALDRISRRIR